LYLVGFGNLKRQWCQLKNGRPGRRFQDRCERSRKARAGKSSAWQWLTPLAGLILVAAGIVFCLIPGPGLPLIVIGAALLAERSRTLSRLLDWLEIKLRNLMAWWRSWWRRASPLAKNAVVFFGVGGILAAGYGAYQVVFG
jgi:hypothetical protein